MDEMKKTFQERVDRLKKLVELDAPSYIICAEVNLIFMGAFALYPNEMGNVFSDSMHSHELASCGICPICHGTMRHELHTCYSCLEKEKLEDMK